MIRTFLILLILTSKIYLYIQYNEKGIIRKVLFFILQSYGALTLKISNIALNPFCETTLHLSKVMYYYPYK